MRWYCLLQHCCYAEFVFQRLHLQRQQRNQNPRTSTHAEDEPECFKNEHGIDKGGNSLWTFDGIFMRRICRVLDAPVGESEIKCSAKIVPSIKRIVTTARHFSSKNVWEGV